MFGFTRIVDRDAVVRPQNGRKASELAQAAVAIAVMVALLAVAIGIKVWIFVPRFVH